MFACYLLLIVGSSYTYNMAETAVCQGDLLRNDTFLRKSIFMKFQTVDVFSCASQCQCHRICKSFSFNTVQKVCYLNFKSSKDAENVVSQPGFVYSTVSEWQKMSGPCSSGTCGQRKRCQVLRNGSTKCYDIRFTNAEYDVETYYILHKKYANFDKAREICLNEGGSLVFIDSNEEHHFLSDLFRNLGWGENKMWIGLRYDAQAEDLRWLNGKPVLWHPHSLDTLESCVCMVEGMWVARNCTSDHRYICEFKL